MRAKATTKALVLDREETDSETLTQILAMQDMEVHKVTVEEANRRQKHGLELGLRVANILSNRILLGPWADAASRAQSMVEMLQQKAVEMVTDLSGMESTATSQLGALVAGTQEAQEVQALTAEVSNHSTILTTASALAT